MKIFNYTLSETSVQGLLIGSIIACIIGIFLTVAEIIINLI